MVFKQFPFQFQIRHEFENDVKMYGIQTTNSYHVCVREFENDVKMYGIQTIVAVCLHVL